MKFQGSKCAKLQCCNCGKESENFLVTLMDGEDDNEFQPKKGWDWLRRLGWWLDDEIELNLYDSQGGFATNLKEATETIIYGTCPECYWQRRRTAKVITGGKR